MKHTKRVNFLKGLLNIIGGFILLFLMLSILNCIVFFHDKGAKNTILSIIFSLIFFGGYFMTIFTLRKILNSILEKNPFIPENIICLRKIGYYILSIGLIDAIVNYPKLNNIGFNILLTSHGSLKPIIFLYISLSLLAFILADVFKMAIDIKEENDLTI
ncbi:hypothetical protein CIW83_18665 [Tissierella sp. P1]|uniref:DUF2975 domain-containing protein n=1 Tax=unclassified Tissierella TaxID=2638726 RepID=UPI000BA125CF|nr:DUF2975 domain-containing protein [Tissierella sp. P1]MDU5083182.1 DUF2975 domain-containing protein [Bacillota bacterium]OZV10740.1 hypothetical protein CIW83_18665 [Tissierella sp. P1]